MTVAGGVADLLAETAGSARVVAEPAERAAWAVAGRVPEAVVFPESPDQVAAILGRASDEGIEVVPAGAGRWLDGGGPVREARIVLSTRRMDDVEDYVPGNLTLTAGAGLTLDDLDRTTRRHGQWLPHDPPGGPGATLGAAVATGLPGPLQASFGRPRDQVLGLTLVTGDGRILRPGGRVVKNVAGYDLVRLAAGSWGALGVIAGVTVRLFPVPEVDRTLLWRASEPEALVPAARALATAPVVPAALELAVPSPERGETGGATLALRVLGSRESVEERVRIFREAAGRAPDRTLDAGASGAWHRARSVEEAGQGTGDGDGHGFVELRMAVLPDRLQGLVRRGAELGKAAEASGARCVRRIHATHGLLRVEIRGLTPDEAASPPWPGLLEDLRDGLETVGGSLRMVRLPPALARRLPTLEPEGPVGRLAEDLGREFDPAGILSPGRGVP